MIPTVNEKRQQLAAINSGQALNSSQTDRWNAGPTVYFLHTALSTVENFAMCQVINIFGLPQLYNSLSKGSPKIVLKQNSWNAALLRFLRYFLPQKKPKQNLGVKAGSSTSQFTAVFTAGDAYMIFVNCVTESLLKK